MSIGDKVRDFAAVIASIAVVIFALIMVYILVVPTEVLKDWTITVPEGDHYVGDTMPVVYHYTKVMNVSGTAKRYIECRTIGATYTRYPLSEAEANHTAGTRTGTGLFVTIPNIPQVPTKCHITISVVYTVYSFKKQNESAQSKDFTVLPKVVE